MKLQVERASGISSITCINCCFQVFALVIMTITDSTVSHLYEFLAIYLNKDVPIVLLLLSAVLSLLWVRSAGIEVLKITGQNDPALHKRLWFWGGSKLPPGSSDTGLYRKSPNAPLCNLFLKKRLSNKDIKIHSLQEITWLGFLLDLAFSLNIHRRFYEIRTAPLK